MAKAGDAVFNRQGNQVGVWRACSRCGELFSQPTLSTRTTCPWCS